MNINDFDFSNFDPVLNSIIDIVKEAGDKVMEIYTSDFSYEIKDDKTFVTAADTESEKIILRGLKKFDYGIISEETNKRKQNKNNRTFIIDPLDGTFVFVKKKDEFSIMIGVFENEYPIIGVVYAPAIDKLYFAQKNKGSYLIHKNKISKLNVSKISDIYNSKIVCGLSHPNENEKNFREFLGIKNSASMGSIGNKLGYLAEGKAEIYTNIFGKLGIWDVCAPLIILEEAGGIVRNKFGEKINLNMDEDMIKEGLIASNKNLFDKIKKGVSEFESR